MNIEEVGVLLSKTLNETNSRTVRFTENIGKPTNIKLTYICT